MGSEVSPPHRPHLPKSKYLIAGALSLIGALSPMVSAVEEAPARERARQFAEDDRQFLRELEGRAPASRSEPKQPEVDQRTNAKPARLRINAKEARKFLNAYLRAGEASSPEQEISFFADEVKYFRDRKVIKEVIAKDVESYYERWPERRFKLLTEPQIIRDPNGDLLVIFRIRYDVQRGSEKTRGRTENIIRLRNLGDGPKIIAIRERKIED